MQRHVRYIDLAGQKFGALTVVFEGAKDHRGRVTWHCSCDCGETRAVLGANLRNGNTKSCGCLSVLKSAARLTTHGHGRTPEIKCFHAMWQRCTNPKDAAYPRYKDFAPPPDWRDFLVFLNEVGSRPSAGHSLDRINNDKPYGPGNCRWATAAQQNRNRKSNINVSLGGQDMCLADACEETGISYQPVLKKWHQTGDMRAASQGKFDTSKQEK